MLTVGWVELEPTLTVVVATALPPGPVADAVYTAVDAG